MTGPTIHVEPEEIERFAAELHSVYATLEPPEPRIDFNIPVLAAVAPVSRPKATRRLAISGIALGLAVVVAFVVGLHPTLQSGLRATLQPESALAVELLPTASSLNCKLAIHALDASGTTGFVVMNHGLATFVSVNTSAKTYVPGLGVWIAAPAWMVSPDGNWYLTGNSQGATQIVGKNGTRTIYQGKGIVAVGVDKNGQIMVDGFSLPDGINRSSSDPSQIAGIMDNFANEALVLNTGNALLDPNTGIITPRNLSIPANIAFGNAVSSFLRPTNATWIASFTGNTSGPGQSVVDRIDAVTGQEVEWLDSTDTLGIAEVVGADSQGHPIIQVSQGDVWHTDQSKRIGMVIETLIMDAPHHFTVLNSGKYGAPGTVDSLSPLSATSADDVWLASDDGQIWRYTSQSGLQLIARVTTSTHSSPGVAISGPCS